MMESVERILVTKEEIQAAAQRLGQKISMDYAGKDLILIGVLKGGFMFMADLLRFVTVPVQIDFIAVSSYGASTKSSGVVRLIKDTDLVVENKNILLVEDIVDTGLTLSYLKDLFQGRKPQSVKVCTIFDKPARRKTELYADYQGIVIPDEYVVGYGLDFQEKMRNLPDLCVLKKELYETKQ